VDRLGLEDIELGQEIIRSHASLPCWP